MLQIAPASISAVLDAIIKADSAVSEIWLFGSRANGNERADSDWDLLVFGGPASLQALRGQVNADRAGTDVLVVHNGDDFQDPWGTDERCKGGSLSGWQWRRLSDTEAEYVGTHWDEQSSRTISRLLKARRLWPPTVTG